MKKKTIRALQILGSLDVRIGGPAYSVDNLTEYLNTSGIKTDIWTFNYPYSDKKMNFKSGGDHFIAPDFFLSTSLASWNPMAKKHLQKTAANYDILHNHGHWLFGNAYARIVAKKLNKPLIISSRGLLEPWALARRSLKKKLALQLFEKENIKAAALFHATSSQEAEGLRHFGINQPIAVIPNGIDFISSGTTANFHVNKKKVLLFLSRIDSKKGLERLLSIWQRQRKSFPNWELAIAGSGSESYIDKLKKDACAKGINSQLRWIGFVEGALKKELYEKAALFILPTFSENFGNVIGEALSYGVPVITTSGTPWQEIQSERCGWYVQNNELAIEAGLVEAMNTSEAELREIGARGKRFIEKKYSWPKAAQSMADAYRWLLKMREKPSCIRID